MSAASGQIGADRSQMLAGLHTAELACARNGVRFTPIRRAVLEALWDAGEPVGAYDLIRALESRAGRRFSPPTVYRALDFLLEQRLVSRIETRNAFVPRVNPEHERACAFFICETCGTSAEVDNPQVEALFETDAAELGFRIGRRVIELQGTCAHCLSAVHAVG